MCATCACFPACALVPENKTPISFLSEIPIRIRKGTNTRVLAHAHVEHTVCSTCAACGACTDLVVQLRSTLPIICLVRRVSLLLCLYCELKSLLRPSWILVSFGARVSFCCRHGSRVCVLWRLALEAPCRKCGMANCTISRSLAHRKPSRRICHSTRQFCGRVRDQRGALPILRRTAMNACSVLGVPSTAEQQCSAQWQSVRAHLQLHSSITSEHLWQSSHACNFL